MKSSRGVMTTDIIIMAVLGLIALALLIGILRYQLGKTGAQYTKYGEEAQLNLTKCTSIILNRACAAECKTDQNQKQVYSPAGVWDDCKSPKQCCELITI